jgi:PAS domain S-box-containing protein
VTSRRENGTRARPAVERVAALERELEEARAIISSLKRSAPAVGDRAETEERFRALVETSSDILALVERDGTINFVSDAARRVLGQMAEDLCGRALLSLAASEDRRLLADLLDESVRRPRVPLRAELRLLRPDRACCLAEIVLMNRLDEPRLSAIVCFIRDAGARRSAEERYRILLELAPDAMVVTDSEGRIALVNGQAERLFGYGRDELIGRAAERLVPEWQRAAEVGRADATCLRRKDGSQFCAEIRFSPARADELYLTAVIREVAEPPPHPDPGRAARSMANGGHK